MPIIVVDAFRPNGRGGPFHRDRAHMLANAVWPGHRAQRPQKVDYGRRWRAHKMRWGEPETEQRCVIGH